MGAPSHDGDRPGRSPIANYRPQLLLPILLLALLLPAISPAPAEAQNRAGILVDFGGGKFQYRCVHFWAPTINGVELLQRAGFQLTTRGSGAGTQICAINGIGCSPTQPCFCRCSISESSDDSCDAAEAAQACIFWSYWIYDDGKWDFAQRGPGGTLVSNNGVNGWAWGVKRRPPLMTIDQICGP
ncbi:MAG: hypothetical protein AAGD01_11025 [Acidobacteriota bacterium]